ncbi:putative carboxynorspermidine decarboxylase [Liberibacter crescens BT-1]|uniref:Carboxynorspermidine/carboxyspermidine decarboxylase n=1 Tax=Liberibacter crescens (strain BT-1) TaxID=1215343 RepID=L0EXA0_LIBCB|nr:carboxynorspermidine decarboxylase [Liberibacter crescens]AGA65288.1 putative carboxynorspermidine decarboxylase [Liberibacter crescens BT-1]AMC13221.1 carboxynorspermidine decarboxylase [Liberibacter crescens]
MIPTPYYLIDKLSLLKNLEKILHIREQSGVKVLLALKCFASWGVFDVMKKYLDGTTSSSLYEVRLGYEKFGGETHAYSVAYSNTEIDEVLLYCDKIIFNTISQLNQFKEKAQLSGKSIGLRINPSMSYSDFTLSDPNRPFSRLGEWDIERIKTAIDGVNGLMFHNNCENRSFPIFNKMLNNIEKTFGNFISCVDWVSLGGGIHFTDSNYPIELFCNRLKEFSQKYDIQIYLEPGEAVITETTTLEVTVLDTFFNGQNLAIVNSSVEAHMLDLLIYNQSAKVLPNTGPYRTMICGKSCLAGDIFGTFNFENPLQIGDRLSIQDAAGYSIVKKNWFNGVKMPAIVLKEIDGNLHILRDFTYNDYLYSIS